MLLEKQTVSIVRQGLGYNSFEKNKSENNWVKPKCTVCGKSGHISNNCWYRTKNVKTISIWVPKGTNTNSLKIKQIWVPKGTIINFFGSPQKLSSEFSVTNNHGPIRTNMSLNSYLV